MVEKIVAFILSLFSSLKVIPFGKELIVFIISLMPILELRGGLLAASLLNLNPLESYIIAVIGNIIPIPFILWFINNILNWMRKKKKLEKIVKWLDKKVIKHKDQIEKYGFWGLVLFVGIPLPGTGAWTGSLVAALFHFKVKDAVLSILGGLILATCIMCFISYGLPYLVMMITGQ